MPSPLISSGRFISIAKREQTVVFVILLNAYGCPEMKDGYLWVSEKPGWGIEVDEKEAAKSPFTPGRGNPNGGWGEVRKLDGTVIKQ